MSIPEIVLGNASIDDVGIWVTPIRQDLLIPQLPHGVTMALPRIDMPGCVEAHVDSELQTGLTTNDPDRVAIYCDSGMPSFNSMSYEPNRLVPVFKSELPKFANSEAKPADAPEAPFLPIPTQPIHTATTSEAIASSKPRCEQDEFLRDGKCIKLVKPDIPVIAQVAEQYLPPLEAVTTTATIATVATVSALVAKPVADFLLKLIKPMIKKIIAKIKKAMGKSPPLRSVRQRRLAQRSKNRLLRQARDLMG
ncbi:MAG: hypothetical protein CMJ39_00385 [Phycisphaerae bacterium]|nr:hypothetical protein [Phycisphaerae bacterium]|tara:strand:- start:16 stop:768 length:753 start_codon:yes stop_codon:yes gene_type:complete